MARQAEAEREAELMLNAANNIIEEEEHRLKKIQIPFPLKPDRFLTFFIFIWLQEEYIF